MGEEADLWDPVVSGSREREEEIRAGWGGGESTGPRPGPLPCGAGGESWARFHGGFLLFFSFISFFKSFLKRIFEHNQIR